MLIDIMISYIGMILWYNINWSYCSILFLYLFMEKNKLHVWFYDLYGAERLQTNEDTTTADKMEGLRSDMNFFYFAAAGMAEMAPEWGNSQWMTGRWLNKVTVIADSWCWPDSFGAQCKHPWP